MSNSAEPLRTGLRIGVIAPPWYEVPPTAYGGTESVVAQIVDGLVAVGHRVCLVATGRDRTRAELLRTFDRPPQGGLPTAIETAHAALVERRLADRLESGRLDVIHDHSLAGPLLAAARAVPTVVTLHLPPTPELVVYFRALGDRIRLVAISDTQRAAAPDLPWVATVPHGLDVDAFPFSETKDEVVCFLGRFAPEKGAHLAIDAARAAGVAIVLAGRCAEDSEREYFDTEVAPRLGPDAVCIGLADFATKTALLARSRCLVFPIEWEEPFGLVMIEAMACGTPVIGFDRGAVREVVEPGVTGTICSGLDELAEAIRDVKLLEPATCRQRVATRFSREAMVRRYERVYAEAIVAAA